MVFIRLILRPGIMKKLWNIIHVMTVLPISFTRITNLGHTMLNSYYNINNLTIYSFLMLILLELYQDKYFLPLSHGLPAFDR